MPPAWAQDAAPTLSSPGASTTLVMIFAEQPPLLTWDRDTHQPGGTLAVAMNRIAARAGLTLSWQEPWARRRVLADLDAGRQPLCAVNWALTPERAHRFKFTEPLGPPPDWVLVVRAGDTRLGAEPTLGTLLPRPDLIFGFSDGTWVDERYVQPFLPPHAEGQTPTDAPNRERVRGGQSTLLAMVQKGRVDYALVNRASLGRMLSDGNVAQADLRIIPAPDAGPNQPGRVMCTQSIPNALIDRLNQAIAAEATLPVARD